MWLLLYPFRELSGLRRIIQLKRSRHSFLLLNAKVHAKNYNSSLTLFHLYFDLILEEEGGGGKLKILYRYSIYVFSCIYISFKNHTKYIIWHVPSICTKLWYRRNINFDIGNIDSILLKILPKWLYIMQWWSNINLLIRIFTASLT